MTLTTVCGVDRSELERRGAVSPVQFQMADLAGHPDEVVAQLAHYAAAGASRAYLRVLDLRDIDHIELLGATVVPRVAELEGPADGRSGRSSGT